MTKKNRNADIVVVGGGLAGTAAAVCVAQLGLGVLHLAPKAPVDHRTSALMGPSVEILTSSGLISEPDALGVQLTKIRIIDATNRLLRAPEALFESAEIGADSFGWNFTNQNLLHAFDSVAADLSDYRRVEASFSGVTSTNEGFLVETSEGETVSCKLLIGADGKKSSVRDAAGIGIREKKFAQSALVCDLTLERPLEGTSVEFHYSNGPFTLVPAGDKRTNLVWIDKSEVLEKVRSGGSDALISEFEERSMHLFGKVKLDTPTFVFPLSTLTAECAGKDGIALVGESAHAFPPIGAQGLNLGLRDVAGLVDALRAADRTKPDWAKTVSRNYADQREGDLKRTSTMVDTLFQSLLADFLPVQAVRAGGLWALKALPTLRKHAFALGMGAPGK